MLKRENPARGPGSFGGAGAEPPPEDNIVLVGFMGAGKTSVGRRLARLTGNFLVDCDRAIEEAEGRSIASIFQTEGESRFRDLESAWLQGCEPMRSLILSTGGGIVIRPENRRLLPELGFVVWLKADPEVLFDRVCRNKRRPLLQNPDPMGTIRSLLAEREHLYREVAHRVIETNQFNQNALAREILRGLHEFAGRGRTAGFGLNERL